MATRSHATDTPFRISLSDRLCDTVNRTDSHTFVAMLRVHPSYEINIPSTRVWQAEFRQRPVFGLRSDQYDMSASLCEELFRREKENEKVMSLKITVQDTLWRTTIILGLQKN